MRQKAVKKSAIILIFGLFILAGSSSCFFTLEHSLYEHLQKTYNLDPIQSVGDKDFYRITTVYLDMDDYGKVQHKIELEGVFSKQANSFEWMYAKRGERDGQGEITEYTVLPYSQNFRYVFEEWSRGNFPVDLSSIPKTIEGWRFVVKLIDAHTFDVLVNLNLYQGRLIHLGDSAQLPASDVPVSMDFPPLFTDTYFLNSHLTITFQGISLSQGEPCAILVFRSKNNGLHMETNINGHKFPSDGTSYYWGEIFLSLEDKKIIRGAIYERVDLVTSLATLGKPVKHVTRREITIVRIQEKDIR